MNSRVLFGFSSESALAKKGLKSSVSEVTPLPFPASNLHFVRTASFFLSLEAMEAQSGVSRRG